MTDYVNVSSSELKPGDKVRITFTGECVGPGYGTRVKRFLFDGAPDSLFPNYFPSEVMDAAVIQREIPVPPEPAVGDTLQMRNDRGGHIFTIRAIINGRWVTTSNSSDVPYVYEPSAFNAYERTSANGPQ